MSDTKKLQAQERKRERTKIKSLLATLQGLDIDKMTAKQLNDLIKAIAITLELADKTGTIK